MVGHSLGGAVALGLAIHRPEVVDARVSALVLINSSARGPTDRWLTRARVAALDWTFVESVSRHPDHGIALARQLRSPALPESHRGRPRHRLRQPGCASTRAARQLLGIDLVDALSTVRVPVLVLAGSSDRVVSPAAPASTASLILTPGSVAPRRRAHGASGAQRASGGTDRASGRGGRASSRVYPPSCSWVTRRVPEAARVHLLVGPVDVVRPAGTLEPRIRSAEVSNWPASRPWRAERGKA